MTDSLLIAQLHHQTNVAFGMFALACVVIVLVAVTITYNWRVK